MYKKSSRKYNESPSFANKVFCHLTACLRPLPNFLIIGAEKAGTESLYSQIIQHPQIILPLHYSVHYYDENYHKSSMWYRAHFPLRSYLPNKIAGEKTTFYLGHPSAPKRIYDLQPDAKFLLLLRNPTERAISQYFHYKNRGFEPLKIMDALQSEEERINPYLSNMTGGENFKAAHPFKAFSYKYRGQYAQHLKSYFEYFDRDQFKIIKSESYFENPRPYLQEIFEFLEIDQNYKVPDVKARNIGKKVAVDDGVYEYLNDYFEPHNKELKQLLGEEFFW